MTGDCRCLLVDQTGSGAVPLTLAKASLDRNRRSWAVSPMILAVVGAPQPTVASTDGAKTLTRSVISLSRSSISVVNICRYSTSRRPSRRAVVVSVIAKG